MKTSAKSRRKATDWYVYLTGKTHAEIDRLKKTSATARKAIRHDAQLLEMGFNLSEFYALRNGTAQLAGNLEAERDFKDEHWAVFDLSNNDTCVGQIPGVFMNPALAPIYSQL